MRPPSFGNNGKHSRVRRSTARRSMSRMRSSLSSSVRPSARESPTPALLTVPVDPREQAARPPRDAARAVLAREVHFQRFRARLWNGKDVHRQYLAAASRWRGRFPGRPRDERALALKAHVSL
jgi:hypothetical protein